ncbi:MAG: hypothetical protein J6Q36_05680 [Alistipes sp.]|nr:hypothetical protein [Alistipes sp.]
MRRVLSIIATVATIIAILLGVKLHNITAEHERLERNQRALLSKVATYKTRADEWAATAEVLELKLSELRQARREDAKRIKELGIRLREVESYARSVTQKRGGATLPLRDTVIIRDTVKIFSSGRGHSEFSGMVRNDSITYYFTSTDTIYQVVRRVPRRFLFFRYGTKAIHQDVWTSNPSTKVIYTEYIELKKPTRTKRRKRRE